MDNQIELNNKTGTNSKYLVIKYERSKLSIILFIHDFNNRIKLNNIPNGINE